MKPVIMFGYSIISYLIAFLALLGWIISLTPLIPEISIDAPASRPWYEALIINFGLVSLFGVQHSVMARQSFKNRLARYLPRPVERSTFVLISGLLLALLVWCWQPLGGLIWSLPPGSAAWYAMYVLFGAGWLILILSTFLINHFDLFGLRQTWLELRGKPYRPLEFKIIWLYRVVRHPLYFGGIIGVWATPEMTISHLLFATLLTAYFVIGTIFEERDLLRDFGDSYRRYQAQTPMLIPWFKN